ncbi:MAG: ketopantoate reductase family protein [Bacillota bacterium]|nr:ketopantoate reductase family protein [Bacillota bacterium]
MAILGAGAIGGCLAAALHRAGEEVLFLVRPGQARAYGGRLRVEAPEGVTEVEARFLEPGDALPEPDWLVVAVKSYATAEAIRSWQEALPASTSILSPQNGIENEAVLGELLGRERLFPAVVYGPAQKLEDGRIRQGGPLRLTAGLPPELPAALRPRAEGRLTALQTALGRGGIPLTVSSEIMAVKWAKLVWNAVWNPMTALAEREIGAVLEEPGARAVAVAGMGEVVAVAEAEGYHLAESIISDGLALSRAMADQPTSMLADLRARRRLELELVESVVRRAQRHELATPVLSTLAALLRLRHPDLVGGPAG